MVRLSAAMKSNAHAIDVMYHITCWAENVTNVLRKEVAQVESQQTHCVAVASVATEIEFKNCIIESMKGGNVLSLGTLESVYRSMGSANDVDESTLTSRKKLKTFLELELADEGVDFSRPTRLNEPCHLKSLLWKDSKVTLSLILSLINTELSSPYCARLTMKSKNFLQLVSVCCKTKGTLDWELQIWNPCFEKIQKLHYPQFCLSLIHSYHCHIVHV